MHGLRSHMSGLRYCTEPLFDCPDDDLSDDAFVWTSKFIGARDVVEEFVTPLVYCSSCHDPTVTHYVILKVDLNTS
jgi:hypothetical protein